MNLKAPLVSWTFFALVTLLPIPMYAGTSVLSLAVSDVSTHEPVHAKVRIEGPKSLITETDDNGKLRLSLPIGQYQVHVSAPRYRAGGLQVTLWGSYGEDRVREVPMFRAFADQPVYGQTGTLTITVRDVWSHLAVRAKVEIEGPISLTRQTDENGSLKLSLPTGDSYLIQISAPGYRTFFWNALMIRPGENKTEPQLDPMKGPETPPSLKSLEAQLRPGYATVEGLAVDEQGHPVPDVRVTLQGDGIQTVKTTTDSTGYFGFLVPTPPGTPPSPQEPDGLPGTGEVTMAKSGYRTQIHHRVPILDNSTNGTVLVEMKRGSGTDESDDAPAWLNGTAGTCIGEGACDFDKTPEHLKVKPEKSNREPTGVR